MYVGEPFHLRSSKYSADTGSIQADNKFETDNLQLVVNQLLQVLDIDWSKLAGTSE